MPWATSSSIISRCTYSNTPQRFPHFFPRELATHTASQVLRHRGDLRACAAELQESNPQTENSKIQVPLWHPHFAHITCSHLPLYSANRASKTHLFSFSLLGISLILRGQMAANRASRTSYFPSLSEPLTASFGCVSFAFSSLETLNVLFFLAGEQHMFKRFVHMLEDLALEF